jgi:hypothetical protein
LRKTGDGGYKSEKREEGDSLLHSSLLWNWGTVKILGRLKLDFVSRSLSSMLPRSYNRYMPVFDEKQEELEHYETMMGIPRGRLAVTMDTITDAMALVGQHGVYCQSQRWPGKPVMDIQIIMKNLTDAKELIQSVMEELRKARE